MLGGRLGMGCVAIRWRVGRDWNASPPTWRSVMPTVRGLRYAVENLLELSASGTSIEEIIEDHPDLELDDLLAALEFGALASGHRRVVPLSSA